jgi:hypothetical protein
VKNIRRVAAQHIVVIDQIPAARSSWKRRRLAFAAAMACFAGKSAPDQAKKQPLSCNCFPNKKARSAASPR